MGFLGLDATPTEKDDNLFQRLFWPGDHASETDRLGKQGFWICWWVAVFSAGVLLARGMWLTATLTFVFYFLGGVGVREHNQVAAICVAVSYWVNQVHAMSTGRFPGFIGLVAGVLLLANIRGTWVADRWAKKGGADAMPERSKETIMDRFVDFMPIYVWPKAKVMFFVIAAVYMALLTFGVVVSVMTRSVP